MTQVFDDAIVGAGIMGLAHAYALGRRGRRVIVFERNRLAQGASVRNFGMLWPIGQPAGPALELALRSRRLWLDVLQQADLWHESTGSFHVAYHELEESVIREFLAQAKGAPYECAWYGPDQVVKRSPSVRPEGLRGGLWSATEICIDPRQVLAGLPGWLQQRFGVQFRFGHTVTAYDQPRVTANGHSWEAENLYVCAGDDFQTLFPAAFAGSGLFRVKLQMLRSSPLRGDFRLGPMLAAGLTLCHYKAFQGCPSLPRLREHFAKQWPRQVHYGIHVMAAQNHMGELAIGDSHEYDDDISPFDKTEIDELILNYLQTFLHIPELTITSRWHGIYCGHPTELCWMDHPAPGVTIVASPSGRGMTMSFGIGERNVADTLGALNT